LIAVLALPALPVGAALYTEDFEVDPTAQWTLNGGPSDEAANFFFDYSTVGIPLAPNSALGGARGMKLQANLSAGVFGGMSVSPTGESFMGDYVLRFDWWANFNGPFPVGGSGSTMLSTFGVGTAGTLVQWPGGTQDSVWFGATADGNSSSDWRAYSTAAPTRYTDDSGVYAAGAVAGSTNASDPYYASFGAVGAPAAQILLFPQQTGSTLVGSAGMEWHQVEIRKQGTTVTWTVDGLLIATIDLTTVMLGGSNIFFGHSDVNATSSTDPNDAALLFTLIDNVEVLEVGPDLTVTKTDSPDPVAPGGDLTYLITVTNAGPADVLGVELLDATPPDTTFVSFVAPPGWVVMTPAVGGTGDITANLGTLEAMSPQMFTLVVNVNGGTPDDTVVTNTVTVSAETADPEPDDNSAMAMTTVSTEITPTPTATATSTATATPTQTPTRTPTGEDGGLYEIPTVSRAGAVLLVVLLAGMAVAVLLRERR
jgi:uncharacterized repeat protein (TIGR01451 family)